MSEREASKDDVNFRLHCFLLWESAFVDFLDLGFRDCWFASVASYASSNITLRDSVVDGSTWAFLAVGKKAVPETAHSFQVTGNVWRQSPSTYRSRPDLCDIRKDWDCPASVWSELPWGVVHHHFWSPLNGALFMAMDISGNVRVANNHLTEAYNGLRAKLSSTCRKDPQCKEKTNIGFEISNNFFDRIRDNAVEPERHAAFWIVKHNTFLDSYAVISTDGVSGHDLLVFGNLFLLTKAPGSNCRDEGWQGSRQFQATRGGGTWSAEVAEGDDASCLSHLMGTAVKLGGDDDDPDYPLLQRILFFNNSLKTRSPLFRGSPSPPISSYNNAVEFTGCGTGGEPDCRQMVSPDLSCQGKDFWTQDRSALFADCFSTLDYKGNPVPHRMRSNAYNRLPPSTVDPVDKERARAGVAFAAADSSGTKDNVAIEKAFAIGEDNALARDGCELRYAAGDLVCADAGGPIGAMLPDGGRFDLELPFAFPFTEVLRRAIGNR